MYVKCLLMIPSTSMAYRFNTMLCHALVFEKQFSIVLHCANGIWKKYAKTNWCSTISDSVRINLPFNEKWKMQNIKWLFQLTSSLFKVNHCNGQHHWLVMTANCFHRFQKIMKVTTSMAAVCGCNIFNPDFRVNYHTWMVIHAIHAFLILSAYTMYHSLAVVGDWKLMLQSFGVVGSGLQVNLLVFLYSIKRLIFLGLPTF